MPFSPICVFFVFAKRAVIECVCILSQPLLCIIESEWRKNDKNRLSIGRGGVHVPAFGDKARLPAKGIAVKQTRRSVFKGGER